MDSLLSDLLTHPRSVSLTKWFGKLPSPPATLLGAGGVGKVWVDPKDPKSVLKLINADSKESKIDALITVVPSPFNKPIILLSPILQEAIVSTILEPLTQNRMAPFFPRVTSMILSPLGKKSGLLRLERVEPSLSEWLGLNDPRTAPLLLLQGLTALTVAVTTFRFSHLDIHPANLLATRTKKEWMSFPVPCRDRGSKSRLYLPLNGFSLILNDLGHARVETPKAFVFRNVDRRIYPDFSNFLPGYDLLTFLDSLRTFEAAKGLVTKLIARLPANIWHMFEKSKRGKFRANPTLYYPVDPAWLLGQTMDLLLSEGIGTLVRPESSSIIDLTPLTHYPRLIHNITTPKFGSDVGPKLTSLGFGTLVSNEKVEMKLHHRSWMITLPPSRDRKTDSTIQYTSLALFNYRALAENNMQLTTVCCRFDPIQYLHRIKSRSFAVNGGFFRIRETFVPVGPSRIGPDLVTTDPIAEPYREWFRYVRIAPDRISIESEIPSSGNFFSTGPLLVSKGKVVFGNEVLKTKIKIGTDEVFAYLCKPKPVASKVVKEYMRVRDETGEQKMVKIAVINCDTMAASTLAHAANPNPRSALLLFGPDSSADFGFLIVEGRDLRGSGMTLPELADYCLKLGAYEAISLDGGRTSSMAWRRRGGSIETPNPETRGPYVAGNLIVLETKTETTKIL